MKVERRIFNWLGLFFLAVGAVYGYWTWRAGDIEWVGFPALLLSAGLSMMIGWYLGVEAKGMDARPEDNLDGEIAEGAGELGFFSPYSWWPIAVAGASGIVALGMAIGFWVILIGLVATVLTVIGLVFEYYVGDHAH